MAKKKMRFSDEIREAIRRSEFSCYRICRETGIDKGNLSRFMNQVHGLGIDALDRIAELINLHAVTSKSPRKRR